MRKRTLGRRYRLIEEIGSGGMGTVYRARDTRTRSTVAVKVLHPHLTGDAEYLERFRREAETVAQRPSRQGIVATSPLIAYQVQATDLLKAWGAGDYAMRMYLSGTTAPFAMGRFTLVEPPVAA